MSNAKVSADHNSTLGGDSHAGLMALHSPLLDQSLLVSFPPLNYMLKFSGSSCLSQDQGRFCTHQNNAKDKTVQVKKNSNCSRSSAAMKKMLGIDQTE